MADYDLRQMSREPSHLRQTDPEAGDAINRSLTRNSHLSHASHASASTRSWVQSTQQNPPPPPPVEPFLETSSIRPPRPLPNPKLHPQRFHAVNPTEGFDDEEDEEYMNIEPNGPGLELGYLHGVGKGHKLKTFGSFSQTDSGGGGGKSFVGGFVSGMKRIPRMMLRSGGSGEKRRFFRRGPTSNTTESSTGMTTGNTLPQYASNPPTPVAGLPNVKYVQAMDMPTPMAPSTEVLAPSFSPGAPIPRVRGPSFRVTPPSESIANEESAQFYDEHPEQYDSRPQVYDQQYASRPQVYEDRPLDQSHFVDEDDSTARPHTKGRIPTVMMYQDSQEPHHNDPPPIPMVIPSHSSARSRTHTPSAHTPSRSRAHTPTHTPSRSPAIPPLNLVPTRRQTAQTNDTDPNIQSPAANAVSGHTRDYRKMTLSPSPTSRNTVMTTATSYYDPSFTSDLSPIERFFKTLYHLPWIAHERVTIDYRPGEGSRAKRDGKRRVKKPMSSWYRDVMAKRRTADLDLLSSGSTSMRTSVGTNLTLGSPMSPVSGRSSKRTSREHHHHHHKKSTGHRRHKPRRSTEGEEPPRSASPIIPTAYPYAYPSYPYAFPAYMPPPPPPPPPPTHKSPRGPRSHRQATTHPAGYVQYQPMHAPLPPPVPQTQMYVLQSSPTMTQTSVEGQMQQGQILSPVYMQVVPGAYSPDNKVTSPPQASSAG
ncbi:uncharacterized protein LACBIDRAFT_304756 [Laccaria bicolor S238N-H82]|uniref:Predicted protein n=1 Tax=Laccaria bicolor (strain S238N-H82 / ATCC MYA-4686) TaxID=486041 RepID=B0DM95_LACBS|nr:uncharacterized protein LACBIDRAFT_304756 [Laccaria bicolor S238N-H82]EDR04157.1 predicted protein [Laccaria bicolor S238N-H82]|eukprot:XP_001885048.1 predicted protein [Laccaria bicolor S238N-H82]